MSCQQQKNNYFLNKIKYYNQNQKIKIKNIYSWSKTEIIINKNFHNSFILRFCKTKDFLNFLDLLLTKCFLRCVYNAISNVTPTIFSFNNSGFLFISFSTILYVRFLIDSSCWPCTYVVFHKIFYLVLQSFYIVILILAEHKHVLLR